MNNETRGTLIWLFCILIISVLIGKIAIESGDYDCSKCTVVLVNTPPVGEPYDFGEFAIKELFETYSNTGRCLIKWDPTQGYYNG